MKTIKLLFMCVLIAGLSACNSNGNYKKELKTELDSVTYAIGLDMGLKVRANLAEADEAIYIQGFLNGIDSTNIKINKDSIGMVINSYMQKKRLEEQKRRQEEHLKKIEEQYGHLIGEGEKFLEENKSKPGVVTTESGLQYIVIKEGTGDTPDLTSMVKVHYHGTLMDGTVFESTIEKDSPATFGVNRVIKGWTEGLQLMKEGGKYKFFIPQELGYGATPRQGGKIKPYMPLIFELELIEILNKKDK